MANQKFRAMVVEESPDGTFRKSIREKYTDELPGNDVLIRVLYSSLNYKDALSATGNRGVTKNYPHTPGIDASGIVEETRSPQFKPGDQVIVTSYDLGMNTPGGFGQFIRVPAEWVVKLPQNLSLKESMIFGTAGFTAGVGVWHLSRLRPDQGEILVTGATGGVGSLAVAILSQCGYSVTAATGKTAEKQFLTDLGAKNIIDRSELSDIVSRPLLKARWAGVLDTVGGDMLAAAVKSTDLYGIVTCCGNAASPNLPLTVYPFILRGISLIGISSQNTPMDLRINIWQKLSGQWKPEKLETLARYIPLEKLDENISLILKAQQKGRAVVDLEK